MPYADEGFGRIVDGWFAETDAILIGRTTYEMFYGYWPQVTDPDDLVATQLNQCPKYVVSTTLPEVSWHNSTVIGGDVVKAVAELKAQPGRELQVHGSCQLAQTLHDAGMIDEYRLLVFPVILGEGKRLFKDGASPRRSAWSTRKPPPLASSRTPSAQPAPRRAAPHLPSLTARRPSTRTSERR